MLRRFLSLFTYCALIGLFIALGSAILSRDCADLDEAAHFDSIVILSGSLGDHGSLGPDTALRTDAAIALYQRGVAPHLHMTGGVTDNRVHIAAAIQMADRAAEAGVPEAAITIEDNSRSTLENARNSAPFLEGKDDILLVSDGYHLWRGALSFAWAGAPVDAVCKSSTLRPDGVQMSARLVVREALAFWYNLGRATVWSAADLLGVTPHLGGAFLH